MAATMRKALSLLVASAALAATSTAFAHGGWQQRGGGRVYSPPVAIAVHGGGYGGGYYRGGHGGGYGGYGRGWVAPRPIYAPPLAVYPAPRLVIAPPPVFIAPPRVIYAPPPPIYYAPPVAQVAPQQQIFYYCADYREYYPRVESCPSNWLRVLPDNTIIQ
jgi:hypothetical protein